MKLSMQISRHGKPVTKEAIAIIETKWGIALPNDYKTFLLTKNGGRPDSDVSVKIDGFPELETDIHSFFGIGYGDNKTFTDLEECIEFYNQRYPNWFLFPIARDSGGGVFGFMVDNGAARRIVFYDLGNPHLYHVADSFDEFMKKITVD